ncbi:oxidation resistance protein 1 [Pichia californica]|nr:oxidation resistance protein 1 [[Candida] californica]
MSGSPLQKIRSVFLKKTNSNHNSDSERSNSNRSQNNGNSNSSIDDEFEEPPLTPLTLIGYKNATKHKLLTPELAEEIRHHIPSLLQINHNWKLLYSVEQSGTSLQTLYSNLQPKFGENTTRRRGYIMIVQDTHKNKFGAYLNDYLRPLDGKYYYGNCDCFLWKLEKGKVKHLSNRHHDHDHAHNEENEVYNLKVFPYTSLNDFIIYSNNDFISVGSGDGKFGLWIDSNFELGASDTVETFGNEPLSDHKKFHILGLEIWKIN